jgi:hypothetical protein
VAGVEYEQRAALLGAWVSERGKIKLREFLEALLTQGTAGLAVSQQAGSLLDRTTVSGEVRLGDGTLAVPGLRAEMAARGVGHNTVRLQAEAAGRGITAEIASLWMRALVLDLGAMEVQCDQVAGALTLNVVIDSGKLRFDLNVAGIKFTGLRLLKKQ